MTVVKEACVDNIQDAINAFKKGADRIEFCSNLDEDGLTPSNYDLISLKKSISIPVRVMVRPHSNSFNYNDDDLIQMKETIDFCKNQKFDGVVFGCLDDNNELDLNKIKYLADYAKPLNVIIHKAIDLTSSPVKSLMKLFELEQDHDLAIIGVMGPKSNQLLTRLFSDNSAIDALPYYHSGVFQSNNLSVRANRLSYVGERGYELYVAKTQARSLWQQLMSEGADLQITPAGFHAMNACRMEKGYRHWGHDIYDHITPLQAGLGFAVAKDKTDFIGHAALADQQGVQTRRLVHLAIEGSDAPFMIHDEPVYLSLIHI